MKRIIWIYTVLLLSLASQVQVLQAQDYWADISSPETVATPANDDILYVPENWDANLDSLLNSWNVKQYTRKKANPAYQERNTVNNDSTYVKRLSKLNNIIELPYNEIIRNCIDAYVERRRTSVEYMLGLENFYFPMIEQALDKYGLPHELKYLSIVESALNPTALSRAGASGLWQFMLPTGKQYGLEINSLVDERRDPLKATYAACQYFSDLYAIYGDWTLVIAAYNCGPGNVNKAITRANRSTDYWSIYPYLPQETRMYVPLFIAVNYVMNYYAQHQLYPVETNLPAATDTITINQQIHFDQISAVLGIEKEYLRALNPQYKRDIIPGNSMPRTLKLPSMLAYAFIEKQEDIVKYKADEIFTNRTYVGDYTQNNNEKIVYKVKRGETLATVAGKYGVTMSNIRKWNGLKSNKVKPGRSLILYVDNGGYNLKPNREEKFNREEKPNRKENVGAKKTPEDTASLGKYKIKKGDTYYNIAKKYPGCSASDLMRINNTTNKALKVGQYIKVPKG